MISDILNIKRGLTSIIGSGARRNLCMLWLKNFRLRQGYRLHRKNICARAYYNTL